MQSRDRLDATAVSLVLLLCMLWGTNQVAIKLAGEAVPPMLQAGLRSAGSGVLTLAWCLVMRVKLFARDGSLLPGIAAGLIFGFEFMLLYLGVAHTTASRAVLFFSCAPFAVAIGSHYFVPGERLTSSKSAGLILAFAGVALVFSDGLALAGRDKGIGDLLCLGAGMLWGSGTVLIKSTSLRRVAAAKTLLYQLAVSAVIMLAFSHLSGENWSIAPLPGPLAALAYTIVVISFASYLAWFWLLKNYPASGLASFTFLIPVFGVLAGNLMLDEPLTWRLLGALILIAAGIQLVNRRVQRPARSLVG